MSDLEQLSKTSGVDFVSLKDKYSKIKSSNISAIANDNDCGNNDNSKNLSAAEQKNIDEKLSKYHICKTCNGLGIVKSIYNHMTMEKTCEDCDGDSIILESQLDLIKQTM